MATQTLSIVLLLSVILQTVFLSLQHVQNKLFRGTGYWLLASVAFTAAMTAMLAHVSEPKLQFAIVLQNALLIVGACLQYIGCQLFLEKAIQQRIASTVSAVFLLALFAANFLLDSSLLHTCSTYLALCIFSLLIAWSCFSDKAEDLRFSVRFVGCLFLLRGMVFLARIVAILAGSPVDSYVAPGLGQQLMLLFGVATVSLESFGFIFMINQRLNAESQNARNHAEAVFNMSPDAVMITRAHDGLIVDINETFTTATGYTREDCIGKSVNDINLHQNREKRPVLLAALLKQGFFNNVETTYRAKDGRILIGSVSARIFVLKEVPHFITVTRDITERHRLMEAAQRNQKLESLGFLAGGIAHDFNNLMSGVFGFVSLADSISTDERVRKYLLKAVATIERARALTGQLLTFSKGGNPVRQVGLLSPFLEDSVRFALSGSNIACSFDIPDSLAPCNFDRNQMAQVIDNLVINAKQAMPTNGALHVSAANVTIADSTHLSLPSGNYVRIEIRDNGCGISKENMNHIFDPFFTTKNTGNGLGLSTCFSIIKKHDGAIEAESEEGKGTKISITLPAASEQKICNEKPPSDPLNHFGNGRILVMDDEECLRNAVGEMLTLMGYEPVLAHNEQTLLECFLAERDKGNKVDAVLLDLTIPGSLGGLKAAEMLRSVDSTIPLFVMSGYAEDPVMANPTGFGFAASLCKPFTISELGKMLKKKLSV